MTYWLFIFGMCSGVTTWLFGFGGGFVTVPLIWLMVRGTEGVAEGHAMQIAVATSALVMLCSSLLATWKHCRTGGIRFLAIRHILAGVALGGVLGVFCARAVSDDWIRWLFIFYLSVTILDCYFRAGFMEPQSEKTLYGVFHELTVGSIIGLIAAFLGVGGSVMTVPLMRRRGATMAEAAAMANTLTLPLAVTASLTWLVMARGETVDLPGGFIGYIWLQAALLLVAGAWLGMRISARWLSRLPDKWHARIYPLLLIVVLLLMLLNK
ncbi:sulfite exporter TauE/SafE family protein [Citrobacter koseri]|uniref:sulfite exporter TauE/SafE family protein n=1 Tax=Citrobacter koseri TaxID=545 RepID=UPI0038925416